MRTVLLGNDFIYDKLGRLVPIELNTNVGMTYMTPELDDEIFDLTELGNFIIENKFAEVAYIGSIKLFAQKLHELCDSLNILFNNYIIAYGDDVPHIEDTTSILIIRSTYDNFAVLDAEYCKNKVNFLTLIKNQAYSSQFAYYDGGTLINNISTIVDNGNHPNFILKAIYPNYNKSLYPKLFKVSSQVELDKLIANIPEGYFLMEFHINPNKLFEGILQVFRTMNILFPPQLKSIPVGQYTRLSEKKIDDQSTYNQDTFELEHEHRKKYITNEASIRLPKLIDSDSVVLGDGTMKTALQLENGDIVKTIVVPNPNNVDINSPVAKFGITYEEFVSGVTYSTNVVYGKERVDILTDYVKLTFTDETVWEDTAGSSYLIVRNNEVRYVFLGEKYPTHLQIGDEIILMDTTESETVSITKEIKNIEISRQIFSGWIISVAEQKNFMTQSNDSTSFVSIEHNAGQCAQNCFNDCGKGNKCCCTSDCYCLNEFEDCDAC